MVTSKQAISDCVSENSKPTAGSVDSETERIGPQLQDLSFKSNTLRLKFLKFCSRLLTFRYDYNSPIRS